MLSVCASPDIIYNLVYTGADRDIPVFFDSGGVWKEGKDVEGKWASVPSLLFRTPLGTQMHCHTTLLPSPYLLILLRQREGGGKNHVQI
jgi:hypothetical protein